MEFQIYVENLIIRQKIKFLRELRENVENGPVSINISPLQCQSQNSCKIIVKWLGCQTIELKESIPRGRNFGTITFATLPKNYNFRHVRVNIHIYCKSGNSISLKLNVY